MPEVIGFPKVKKKYALNNSYFKNHHHNMPSTPFEVLEYYKQHGELPYSGEANEHWFYDCFVEFQKRRGVVRQQFFTPPATAKRMVEILDEYATRGEQILDACCGFGQLTQALKREEFEQVESFDIDKQLVDVCYDLHGSGTFVHDFADESPVRHRYQFIISNPPYEQKDLTAFLEFLHESLFDFGLAILLIPVNFLDKSRPAKLVQILNKFSIKHREEMTEPFARTGTRSEIVVLEKI